MEGRGWTRPFSPAMLVVCFEVGEACKHGAPNFNLKWYNPFYTFRTLSPHFAACLYTLIPNKFLQKEWG